MPNTQRAEGQHTPGPWHVHGYGKPPEQNLPGFWAIASDTAKNRKPNCTHLVGMAYTEEDARIIASAPALQAENDALRALAGAVLAETFSDCKTVQEMAQLGVRLKRQARAALALGQGVKDA